MTQTREQIKNSEALKQVNMAKIKPQLKLTDLVIPITLGVVSVIIGIFVFVPMVESALKSRSELKDIKTKQEQITKLNRAVSSIDEATMQIDLLNAKKVIPKSLTVSSFIYYVDELAKKLNLTSKTLSAGDIQITTGTKDEKQSYSGVSGPLAYSGSREDVLDFLDSLYAASPYIISADNISLEQSTTVNDEWRVALNITGYYVLEKSYRVDLYLPFSVYTNKPEVIEIFTEKAEKLK